MATFYLFNNANFDGSYTISAGGDKTWSSARTVAGTISKVKIVFTNTGKAKVSARLMIDGKSQGLASEKTYSAGTNTITIIAFSRSPYNSYIRRYFVKCKSSRSYTM